MPAPPGGVAAAAAGLGSPRLQRCWPLPALLVWAGCWTVFAALRGAGAAPAVAAAVATGLGVTIALAAPTTPWRRACIGVGFPLSLAASGAAAGLPAWAWLAPLAALALLYPVSAWRDAPVFPTPRGALRGLAASLSLPPSARLLDAGAGLGDALRELHREWPEAACTGIERSRALCLLSALRCPFASVRRGDMWAVDWSGFDLVYLFQRPESMPRAAAKAARELAAGAWLASHEFAIDGRDADRVFTCADGRPLWLYRAPLA